MPAEIKPICGLERVKLADVIPLATPFSIYIFPTTFCNFKCYYCAHSVGHKQMKSLYNFTAEHMSMDTFRQVISQLSGFPQKLKVISLTGHGEPLLHPDIVEMTRIAKASGVAEKVEIISNGSLLTEEIADGLIDAGLDNLRVSLQGLSTEAYQESCGSAVDFSHLWKMLGHYFKKSRNTASHLFVKIIDSLLGEAGKEDFYRLFGNIADRMYVEKLHAVYDGVDVDGQCEKGANRYGEKNQRRKVCPLPFFMLGVWPDGSVEPCDTIYKPIVLGRVQQKNIVDMWNSDELRDFRVSHLCGGRDNNHGCSRCCAPEDVAHEEDILDHNAEMLLARLRKDVSHAKK